MLISSYNVLFKLVVYYVLLPTQFMFVLTYFQSPERLEDLLDNLGPNELFCDPDFPADSRALYFSEDKLLADKTVLWKRPQVVLKKRFFAASSIA